MDLFLEDFSSSFSLPVYVCSVSVEAQATLSYVWMVGASVGNFIWAKLILQMRLMLAKTFKILRGTALQKTNLIMSTSSQLHGFSFSLSFRKTSDFKTNPNLSLQRHPALSALFFRAQ